MERAQRPQNFQSRQKMKFTKTEAEYNMKSIRFLLLTITIMYIMIAVLMIVLGMSVYSHYHNFSFFIESARSGRIMTPSVMSVLLGIVLLVITSFGFFGSLKLSTCMVNIYALLLALMLVVKLAVVILAFTIQPKNILNHFDVPLWGYTSDPEIQEEIDHIQRALNCCGSESYLDYLHVELPENYTSVTVVKEVNGDLLTIELPQSCCISAGDSFCTKMRTTGCKEALVNVVVQNSSVLGVLGVSVMFIQLLGVVFAVLLARCIRKLKSEKALISWKIKEKMILAREEQNRSVYISQEDSSVA